MEGLFLFGEPSLPGMGSQSALFWLLYLQLLASAKIQGSSPLLSPNPALQTYILGWILS